MTYDQLMNLLWRWKYGPVQGEQDQRIVTINDVRQAVVQYGQAEADSGRNGGDVE